MNELNNVNFKNPHQIINMGGPWIGDLYLGDIQISGNVIIDNLIFKQDKLYFVKYNKVSKWKNKNFFSLIVLEYSSMRISAFQMAFEQIFISNIDADILTYYDAFHEGKEQNRKKLDLSGLKKEFSGINNNEKH